MIKQYVTRHLTLYINTRFAVQWYSVQQKLKANSYTAMQEQGGYTLCWKNECLCQALVRPLSFCTYWNHMTENLKKCQNRQQLFFHKSALCIQYHIYINIFFLFWKTGCKVIHTFFYCFIKIYNIQQQTNPFKNSWHADRKKTFGFSIFPQYNPWENSSRFAFFPIGVL